MQKTTQNDYLAALEEANSAIEDDCKDDNTPGFDSEAEQAAASLPPKRKKTNIKPLTEQQRLFATLVIQGKTRREAYRQAYNTKIGRAHV